MIMLSIEWEEYKRLLDDLRKRKPISLSGYPFWTEKENNYVIYLSTGEFAYRCIVSKSKISEIDSMEYIKFGFKVKGRVI